MLKNRISKNIPVTIKQQEYIIIVETELNNLNIPFLNKYNKIQEKFNIIK